MTPKVDPSPVGVPVPSYPRPHSHLPYLVSTDMIPPPPLPTCQQSQSHILSQEQSSRVPTMWGDLGGRGIMQAPTPPDPPGHILCAWAPEPLSAPPGLLLCMLWPTFWACPHLFFSQACLPTLTEDSSGSLWGPRESHATFSATWTEAPLGIQCPP